MAVIIEREAGATLASLDFVEPCQGRLVGADTGRGLTLVWFDVSNIPVERAALRRGHIYSRLEVRDYTGKTVGHVTAVHTTRDLLTALFPTPLHWADRNAGAHFDLGSCNSTPEAVLAEARRNLRDDTLPPADVLAQYQARQDAFEKFLQTPYVGSAQLNMYVTTPDGANVRLLGTGAGQWMYAAAARELARHGKVLRASCVQTVEAQRLWLRLAFNRHISTHDVTVACWDGNEETFTCIDYR